MKTTKGGWDTQAAAAKKVFNASNSSVPALLKAIDDAFKEVETELSGYADVQKLYYDSQGPTIKTIAAQGEGLTQFTNLVNDELLDKVNSPFISSLDSIIGNLSAVSAQDIISEEAFNNVIDIDYQDVFAAGSLGPYFLKALEIQALKLAIDQRIREGLVMLDDPNDIDELLELEDLLSPELAVLLAGVTDADVLAILQGYFEKQLWILLTEHRAIHNYVRDYVAAQVGGSIEVPIYGGGRKASGDTYGFMDVYNFANGQVWEIKAYRQSSGGLDQIERYVKAGGIGSNETKFPMGVTQGKDIEPTTIQLGKYTLEIFSMPPVDDNPQTGVVLYRYQRSQQPQEQEQYQEQPATAPVYGAVPNENEAYERSSQPRGTTTVQDWVEVGVFVFGAMLVVGVIALCIFCPPAGLAVLEYAGAAAVLVIIGLLLYPEIIDTTDNTL
jgi:hypothetical protein